MVSSAAEVVDSPPAPPRASSRTTARRPLLWLLGAVVVASLLIRVAWDQARSRSLANASMSDLRIMAREQPLDGQVRTRLAERCLWEERNEDALREARMAVELSPRSAQAHYVLGKACQRQSNPQQALTALKRAVQLDSNHTQARFLLGHGYYWHEQPLLAAKEFEKYIEQQPVDDIGFRFLGLARMKLGGEIAARAEPALLRAVELGPDASGNHQALGSFYMGRAQDRGDVERAAESFMKAVEIDPRGDTNRRLAATALQRLDRFAEAAAQYEAVFAKSPTEEKICYQLLQLYTRMGDRTRAERYRKLYMKITRARDATSAITAPEPGRAAHPSR